MRRYVAFTPERRKAYLLALARTGRRAEAALAAGLRLRYVQDQEREEPELKEQVGEALQVFRESLEREVHRRAVEGWDEPEFYKGSVCGEKRRFDSGLLLALIRKYDPAFREKISVDANVTGGVLVVGRVAQDEAEFKRLIEETREREG